MKTIDERQCNRCEHENACARGLLNPNLDIADDGETPVCNDYKSKKTKRIMIAEITEGWDGKTVERKICATKDDAEAFIRDSAERITTRMKADWWCTNCQNGDTIVDFGSHIYFGRIKEEVEA